MVLLAECKRRRAYGRVSMSYAELAKLACLGELDDAWVVVDAMRLSGLVRVEKDDRLDFTITIRGWRKWQGEKLRNDPTAAERMRRYRQRQKEAAGVTRRNATVTPQVSLPVEPETLRNAAVTDRNVTPHRKRVERTTSVSNETVEVFEHWKARMGLNGHTRLTPGRRKKIIERRKTYSVEELVAAIDACAASDFHMGKNDRGRPFNDLAKNILPSDDKVQWWLDQRTKETPNRDPDRPSFVHIRN